MLDVAFASGFETVLTEPTDITELLRVAPLNRQARQDLLDAVYEQLHAIASAKMAAESSDHTLQPTALINEAYPRLMSAETVEWRDRRHFLGAAAEAMRRVLIDHARRRDRVKRGGGEKTLALDEALVYTNDKSEELIALDEALKSLEAIDSARADVVKLKFFAGLTNAAVSETLEIPIRSVERHWTFARAWLLREISSS